MVDFFFFQSAQKKIMQQMIKTTLRHMPFTRASSVYESIDKKSTHKIMNNTDIVFQAVQKALRQEIRALSDADRESFHSAMNQLKSEMMDGISKYDLFVNFHRATMAPGAHFGAAFLPWHREMLLRYGS